MNSPIRGIRNNNPFNIKRSKQPWIGKKPFPTDRTFEQFALMEYGVRAGLKLLLTYVHRGINTPSKIIHRFAPASENNTQNYIDFVCSSSRGVARLSPDSCINKLDDLLYLASRICKYECNLTIGQQYAFGLDVSTLNKIFHKFNLKF